MKGSHMLIVESLVFESFLTYWATVRNGLVGQRMLLEDFFKGKDVVAILAKVGKLNRQILE